MKNRILLKNYDLPGDLERQIETFIDDYNNQRYHESLFLGILNTERFGISSLRFKFGKRSYLFGVEIKSAYVDSDTLE